MLGLTAKKADGTRVRWVEAVPLSAETAVHTVAPPAQDNGAATLLVPRVSFVNADGRTVRARGISGQFVVVSGGVYAATEQRFEGALWEGPVTDPHDGLVIDEEGAP